VSMLLSLRFGPDHNSKQEVVGPWDLGISTQVQYRQTCRHQHSPQRLGSRSIHHNNFTLHLRVPDIHSNSDITAEYLPSPPRLLNHSSSPSLKHTNLTTTLLGYNLLDTLFTPLTPQLQLRSARLLGTPQRGIRDGHGLERIRWTQIWMEAWMEDS
jgi:hypothetical protein